MVYKNARIINTPHNTNLTSLKNISNPPYNTNHHLLHIFIQIYKKRQSPSKHNPIIPPHSFLFLIKNIYNTVYII